MAADSEKGFQRIVFRDRAPCTKSPTRAQIVGLLFAAAAM